MLSSTVSLLLRMNWNMYMKRKKTMATIFPSFAFVKNVEMKKLYAISVIEKNQCHTKIKVHALLGKIEPLRIKLTMIEIIV